MHTFAARQYCVMLLLIVGADRGGLEPGRSHGNHGNGGVSTVQYSTVQYSHGNHGNGGVSVGTMGHPKH